MKVLYISGRDPAYPRNSIFIKALKVKGMELIECTSSARNYPLRFTSSLLQFLTKRDYDLVFVGFFGQPFIPVIKLFTRKPIVLDAFISGYDTMCHDRKRFRPGSVAGKLLHWLDKRACELADLVICDTNAHIDYFLKEFSIDRRKLARVFVGAEDDIFFPRGNGNGKKDFSVLYYGTYLPLHGTEYVVRAAKLLEEHREIKFKIIGKGIMKDAVDMEVARLGIDNIEFVEWVPYLKLPEEIAQADLCLAGHFSEEDKARRVIANKTFQMMAVGKPVVLGDNPANRELFKHKVDAYFIGLADEDALAGAILELKNDKSLRREISENAQNIFNKRCNLEAIGNRLMEVIGGLDCS
jgi:glycosyltransferase involved in cell wall biosynthesis